MALMACPECGYNVSERAEICPNCGFKVRANQISRLKKHQWKIGFYGFLVLTIILFIIVGNFTYTALFVEAPISLLLTIFVVHTITGIRLKFYNYK